MQDGRPVKADRRPVRRCRFSPCRLRWRRVVDVPSAPIVASVAARSEASTDAIPRTILVSFLVAGQPGVPATNDAAHSSGRYTTRDELRAGALHRQGEAEASDAVDVSVPAPLSHALVRSCVPRLISTGPESLPDSHPMRTRCATMNVSPFTSTHDPIERAARACGSRKGSDVGRKAHLERALDPDLVKLVIPKLRFAAHAGAAIASEAGK